MSEPKYYYLPDGMSFDTVIDTILSDKDLQDSGLTRETTGLVLKSFYGDRLASIVFLKKYALRDKSGRIVEFSINTAMDRWAAAMSKADALFPNGRTPTYFKELYYYFSPSGRQMFALGNPYLPKCSFSSCYTVAIREDSLEGIFDAAYQIAKTYSYGGGQGIDLSPLRPAGAIVSNSARHSTGGASYAGLFSDITGRIGQFGRRGALLLAMRVDHPDIFLFTELKHNNDHDIEFANLSVRITDEFMRAVEEDKDFTLQFDTEHEQIRQVIKAKDLWNQIITAARDKGDPGLQFWDRMIEGSTSEIYPELKIVGTNACGEQPLENAGACCLGSLVMDRFVIDPYTKNAKFDYALFQKMIQRAVRHLDNIVEIGLDKHPLLEQKNKAQQGRRIGLGITGLADMFAALGIGYDSALAIQTVNDIMKVKMTCEYETSACLAKERGPFPLFRKEHLDQPFIKRLDEYTRKQIEEYGLRNVALSTIPPVNSSIVYHCSSGIEPVLYKFATRTVMLGGDKKEYKVTHPGLIRYWKETDASIDPENIFQEAHTINPSNRIRLQATAQQYIDASISSTINLPEDTTVETVGQIYMEAWKAGLKGITVFRDNSKPAVFSKKSSCKCQTDTLCYKFKAEGGDKFYIHVSYRNCDKSKPYQIFVANYKATEYDKFVKISNEIRKLLLDKGLPLEVLKKSPGVESKLEQQEGRSKNTLEKLTRFISLALKCGYIDEILNLLEPYAIVGTLAARLHTILSYKSAEVECPSCGNKVIAEAGCFRCPGCGLEKCS